MSRKVLISFVGTGQRDRNNDSGRLYSVAKYELHNNNIETSFISIALGEMLKIDTYFLFGTMRSMWEEVYHKFAEKKEDKFNEDYWVTLGEQCGDDANHKTPINTELFREIERMIGNGSKIIPIYYGINEKEIKNNFSLFVDAMEYLQDGDEIYLDITHSFRSLPLFATTAISFIKDISNKNIEIKGIYYGMFEVSKEMNNTVPIVDLSYINEMQNWIKGAYSFTHFGNGNLLASLLKNKNKNVSEKLEEFTKFLSMNFIHEVKTQISILTNLSNSDNYDLPEKLIIPKAFKSFSKRFQSLKKVSEYQFELSVWHRENSNYALAYLCLIEAIVTHICEQERFDEQCQDSRNQAKDIIHKNSKYIKEYEIFRIANKYRKNAAHLIGNTHQKSSKAVQELEKFQKDFNKILQNAPQSI